MKKYFLLSTLYFLLSTLIVGCGYTTRAYIGPYKTIYISPFKNSINIASSTSQYANYVSYYPLLETTITQSVVNRFIFDGNLKVVKEQSADVTLKGELISYGRNPLRYADNNEDVIEYRVTLWVNIGLYDNKENKFIWQKNNFPGDSTYFTTGTQAKTEKTALDNAISDLARRIVEEVTEGW